MTDDGRTKDGGPGLLMAGRVMMIYEPWEVTVLPESGQVRVLACYPAALAALREAAAGHQVSEVLTTDEDDYTHALFFTTTEPAVADWINQYLTYLAALPDPTLPDGSSPEAEPGSVPGAEIAQPVVVPRPSAVAHPAEHASSAGAGRQKVSLALVTLAVLACLVMGGAYWYELTAEPSVDRAAQLRQAELAAVEIAGDDAVDPSDEREAREYLAEGRAAVPARPATAPSAPARPENAVPPPAPSGPPLATGNGKLTLWAVDVGQGDGLVLRLPGGGFVVVDANRGGAPAMIALLAAQGCRELVGLVMTHPHQDHMGDLAEIARRFPVRRFYEPGATSTSGTYRHLLRALLSMQVPATTVRPGDQLDWDARVQTTVLSANPAAENLNNSSVVMRLKFGSTAMLLTGDAEGEVETDLVARYRQQLRADVLKVGHHGSRTSSTVGFIEAVRPHYALISCGLDNRFNHPHPTTLQTLAARGVRVFRTDLQGTIAATSDGQRVTVSGTR